MAKPISSKLESQRFGDFTRERIVAILKNSDGGKSEVFASIAATLLAGLDTQGTNPGGDLIDAALDVLARTETPFGQGLLWQAAEHAKNARIRVEAIKRCGPIATPERADCLRRWATKGFQPIVNFQHDQININSIRQAALNALGAVNNPTDDDIEAIMESLVPPHNQAEFSQALFNAACEAYWLAGTVASLPKLVRVISTSWRGDIRANLVGLAAKFSQEELALHGEGLRKALLESTREWWNDAVRANRLLAIAEKLATPQFFLDWTSTYPTDRLDDGRGRITMKLLGKVETGSDCLARGLTILAQSPHNLSRNGPVMRELARCVSAGHGKLIAQTIVAQSNDGHRQLVESGGIFSLYESMNTALTTICEVLAADRHEHNRQQLATAVATGSLASACPREASDATFKANRSEGHNTKNEQESFADIVRLIEQLDSQRNPVAVVARLISPPTSSVGAEAICENWLMRGEVLAQYVMRIVVREAGIRNVLGQDAPMLTRFEQFTLLAQPQRASMKTVLEAALPLEVIVDGRLNRYALDLMQRARLSFQKGAEVALKGIQTEDDALVVLNGLYSEGASDVLAKSIRFHRQGQEALTTYLQATAIALATRLVKQSNDKKRRDTLAGQLHERFQDLLPVREAAYRACGELGSFLSIRPLRERLAKETASSAKKTIASAIDDLRAKLIEATPEQGTAEADKEWLELVADLGDPVLVPQVAGFLIPPHGDLTVKHAAINALERMAGVPSLEVIKKFIGDTVPQGKTLAMARHARLVLEDRNDSNLFDVLGSFFGPEEELMDPIIDYADLLGTALGGITKGLKKSQELFDDGHWDEFVTRVSGLMETVTRLVFRRRPDMLGLDQEKANTVAGGPYRNLLNHTAFRNVFGKLAVHCNTIYAYRGESPVAHTTHTDGSAKAEMTSDDAEYVRDEFKLAFSEAVKALR